MAGTVGGVRTAADLEPGATMAGTAREVITGADLDPGAIMAGAPRSAWLALTPGPVTRISPVRTAGRGFCCSWE
jgi:hypothetical protein